MAMQLLPALAPPRPINVYVDFDGTIAPDEPTDQLFERFAGPDWKAIDEAWLAGRMTSWDATARKVSLLRASKEQIRDFLRTMPIDPDFPAFVDLCRRHGVRLTVVSDGLDLVTAHGTRRSRTDPALQGQRARVAWRRSLGRRLPLSQQQLQLPPRQLQMRASRGGRRIRRDGRRRTVGLLHRRAVSACDRQGLAVAALPGAAAAAHRHA
jgi:haloacid dehalogenase-like hydrolase